MKSLQIVFDMWISVLDCNYIFPSVSCATIDSDNGLSPARRQATIQTIAGL